ncbi:MAG: pyocin knob domain-containing protein [[Eubacterium] siraeum]
MISVSSSFKTNATKPVRNINAKISIGSVDYGIEDIVSLDISRSTSDGGISVGGTSAARLTATIRADLLPTMDAYKVTVFIGFTELTQIGIFYITDLSQEKGYVNIEAYDRFYFLDKPCSFNGSADDTVDTLSFPATHQDLLSYIGKINDFTISAKSNDFAKIKTKPVFNSEATNPTNKYYTYREIIGFIAACNGCNAQFDANDKLIFTRPSNSVETIEEGDCESLSVAQDSGFTVKGIRFTIGTDTAFYIDANGTAYDENLPGVLEAVNPFATVEIMEYVWNKLGGYHYYAADISRRGRGWLLPDDVISIKSNGATKKVTITAISYSLSKDSGFSEHITSTAESTEQSSNRYSAAADHTSNAGAGKYNSTTIINDPVIISERTKEYLKYDYSIIGYSVDDKITYGLDGGDTDIIVQGFKATYNNDGLGAICGDFTVFNGIYGSDKIYAQLFVKFSFYLDITRVIQYSEYTEYWINLMSEYTTVDGDTVKKIETSVRARHGNFSKALKWKEIYPPSTEFPCGRARVILGINFHNNLSVSPEEYMWKSSQAVDVSFSSVDEYNSAVQLTRSPLEKKDVTQIVSKVIEANGTADFPELGDTDVLYIDSSNNSAYKWSSKISAYYCVGRDYFSIKQIQSVAEPNSSEAEILEAQLLQDMRSPAEWTLHSSFVPPKGYMCITDFESGQHGIKIGDGNTPWSELLYVNLYDIDLSEYLKTGDISDWAKADSKPTYTAEEIGAVTPYELDSKDYLKATEITGQTVNLDDIKLNESSDKSKSKRYFCASVSAQNIENRPISANEPFELSVDNIRNINTGAFNTMQRYTSVARKRTYTRWCNDGAWSAWKCDTDVVVYGSVTEDNPKTFAYTTYGEGFSVVEIEAYYDNALNPVRNRKVFALSPTASIERVMLTISNGSSESVTLDNGSVTMSMTGTTALSFMIRYTNSR